LETLQSAESIPAAKIWWIIEKTEATRVASL